MVEVELGCYSYSYELKDGVVVSWVGKVYELELEGLIYFSLVMGVLIYS